MRGQETASSVFSLVMMLRQVESRLLLLVEGDDELTLLMNHVDDDNVKLIDCHGKAAVLGAAKLLAEQGVPGALAVVDRDFDEITGKEVIYPPTVVSTDCYDLLSDILNSDPKLVRHVAWAHSRAAVQEVERTSGLPFVDVVARLCMALAILRLANEEESFGLTLRDFPFRKILSEDYMPLSLEQIAEIAIRRSKSTVSLSKVTRAAEAARERLTDGLRYIGGHDLLSATAAILHATGLKNVKELSEKAIQPSFYTAVSCERLRSLEWQRRVREWGQSYARAVFTC